MDTGSRLVFSPVAGVFAGAVASCLVATLAGCLQTETYRLRADDWQAALARTSVEREHLAVPAERADVDRKPVFVRASLLAGAQVVAGSNRHVWLGSDTESTSDAVPPASPAYVELRLSDDDVRTPVAAAVLAVNTLVVITGLSITVGDLYGGHENVARGVFTDILGIPLMVGGGAALIVSAVLVGLYRDHRVLEVPAKADGSNVLSTRAARARGVASMRWNGGLGFQF